MTMKDETRNLAAEYAVIVNKYCRAFAEKHGWDYDQREWVGDDVGGVIEMCDRFFNFDDIRLDIDKDAEVGEIEAWDDYCMSLYEIGEITNKVNYRSWLMGYRPYTCEQIADMKGRKKKIDEMTAELVQMATDANICSAMSNCGYCPHSELQSDGSYVRCKIFGSFHKSNDNVGKSL